MVYLEVLYSYLKWFRAEIENLETFRSLTERDRHLEVFLHDDVEAFGWPCWLCEWWEVPTAVQFNLCGTRVLAYFHSVSSTRALNYISLSPLIRDQMNSRNYLIVWVVPSRPAALGQPTCWRMVFISITARTAFLNPAQTSLYKLLNVLCFIATKMTTCQLSSHMIDWRWLIDIMLDWCVCHDLSLTVNMQSC